MALRSPFELAKRVRADSISRGRLDEPADGQLGRVERGAPDAERLAGGIRVVAEVVAEREGVALDVVLAGEGGGAVVALVRLGVAVGNAGEGDLVVGPDDDEVLDGRVLRRGSGRRRTRSAATTPLAAIDRAGVGVPDARRRSARSRRRRRGRSPR